MVIDEKIFMWLSYLVFHTFISKFGVELVVLAVSLANFWVALVIFGLAIVCFVWH